MGNTGRKSIKLLYFCKAVYSHIEKIELLTLKNRIASERNRYRVFDILDSTEIPKLALHETSV